MNKFYHLTFALLSLAGVSKAASLKQAEFTRVINDVRMLPSQQQAVPAKIGDKISGLTAVSTGAASRAELQFPDKTLTRIGANSVFKLDKADRTVDLEKGVILLQVPKQIGGAKVRTAAVTAAVTGTTVICERTADGYIKIIVLEGEVDVYLNDKPSVMRTLVAGDILIFKEDATELPLPAKVDLELLKKTSKLMDVAEFGPLGNLKHLAGALDEQDKLKNKGELLATAFEIMGRGTQVTLTNEARQEIYKTLVLQDREAGKRGNGNTGGGNGTGGSGGGNNSSGNITGGAGGSAGNQGNSTSSEAATNLPPSSPTQPIFNPGTTVFGAGSTIDTDPFVTAYNSLTGGVTAMQGTIYNPATHGAINTYLYGVAQSTATIDQFLSDRGSWFAFKGENVIISGNIGVTTGSGPNNLIIASQNGLSLTANPGIPGIATDSSWNVPANVNSLVLAANGSIVQDSSFSLSGAGSAQSLAYYAYGPASDVIITQPIYGGGVSASTLPSSGESNVLVSAGRDVVLTSTYFGFTNIAIEAGQDVRMENYTTLVADKDATITAGRDVTMNNSRITTGKSTNIKAGGSINITSSSLLRALSELPTNVEVALAAINGSVNLNGAYIEGNSATITTQRGDINIIASGIYTDVIKAQVLSTGGQLLINGSYLGNPSAPASLVRLYGDGASGVRFTGDSTISSLSTDIAGKSVTIDTGSMVRLSHPANTRVFTDTANYNNGTHGNFTDLGGTATSVTTNPYNHSSKPAF